jgi:hypothetical protein
VYLLLMGFGGRQVAAVLLLGKATVTSVYQYCREGFFSRVVRLVAASLIFCSMRYKMLCKQ